MVIVLIVLLALHIMAGIMALCVVYHRKQKYILVEHGLNRIIMGCVVIIGGFYSLAVLKFKGKH